MNRPDHPDRPATKISLVDERTDLAWNRSGLALLACGLLVAKGFTLVNFPVSDVAVGAVILGLGVVTYLLAGWHARRRLAPGRRQTAATARDLFPMAVGVASVGAAAFMLGALFPR